MIRTDITPEYKFAPETKETFFEAVLVPFYVGMYEANAEEHTDIH